ncbi:carboxyvinyl-carboxyphosphonate phosphorylmutase [Bradyrhizobium macuxiense]|uniref:Carboxyvinyl-carboxyphosphonate phosphorylmutase n=1 Tax=Bradyrhizobium macuxiense TaxID=1755647 RepID=A0A109JZ23_9BRAD|nr:isocitrate lyase/PEP mutase family protein [Bradyrhizobium macuxiense]KWV57688.1 carboxyvinyl-carboxyphosphonate phosphorylmutase [Bradyrhizobium macuxiense]
MTTQADKFASMLKSGEMIVAPGAYDCITARMVEQAGYSACYMTGAGVAATLGFPDYGLVTMSEMADNAARMTNVLNIPLIADADTGYGNELNVIRTVREYEKRGVAAIQIEDQTFPKRCGHLDNKEVVGLDEFLPKIRAAKSAKANPNFTIIARTDARAVVGFDEAVRRANAALDAGADVAFIEAPQTLEEVRAVPKLVKGPCLLNVVWKGKTPEVTISDARAMGFRIMIFPGMLFKAVIGTCDDVLAGLRSQDKHPVPAGDMNIKAGFARVGANEWDPLRERFRDPSLKLAG